MYEISYHAEKHTNAKSPLITSKPDDSARFDVNAFLRLEILEVHPQRDRAVIHARTHFELLNSDSRAQVSPMVSADQPDLKGKLVEFTILPDGRLGQVAGLDSLLPEEQQAWQEWTSRILLAPQLRTQKVRIGQKWTSSTPETTPAPIAALRWKRESTYVRDEPCHASQLTAEGAAVPAHDEPETCAVILTNATLNQDSNGKNATPDDFKIHELRTAGTARGTNRIITYISLKTGLVIRATEESDQKMEVTVEKTDRSNRVHYGVDAKSHSEVVLVTQSVFTKNSD